MDNSTVSYFSCWNNCELNYLFISIFYSPDFHENRRFYWRLIRWFQSQKQCWEPHENPYLGDENPRIQIWEHHIWIFPILEIWSAFISDLSSPKTHSFLATDFADLLMSSKSVCPFSVTSSVCPFTVMYKYNYKYIFF